MEREKLIAALRCDGIEKDGKCAECLYHGNCIISKQMNAAADALEAAYARMAELVEAQRWIPVGERLPRGNKPVQVYMPKLYMSVQTGFYDRYYGEDDDEWYEHWVAPSEVTHWKPLPSTEGLHGGT